MIPTLTTHYKTLCDEGKITWDEPQARAVEALDTLRESLVNPPKASLLSRLLKPSKPPKGIYLWGDVGRGKSFVMDLFFEHLSEIPKKRVHFHVFMQSVHEQMQALKEIDSVAAKIASEAKVLCFDEFQVTNIADAMIMGRLFKGLFEKGVVVVATSNARPEKLYGGGLHRERFEPFIAILKDHVISLELPGHQDYRRRKVEGRKRYFTPLGSPDTIEGMNRLWSDLIHEGESETLTIQAKGRTLSIDRFSHGVAWTSFDHLCRQALGASDYIEMAQNIRILLLENIPQLTSEDQNEAMRLQTLVDVLYDEGVLIVASAAVEPDQLYLEGQGSESFKRTASRLYEMCYGTKS